MLDLYPLFMKPSDPGGEYGQCFFEGMFQEEENIPIRSIRRAGWRSFLSVYGNVWL